MECFYRSRKSSDLLPGNTTCNIEQNKTKRWTGGVSVQLNFVFYKVSLIHFKYIYLHNTISRSLVSNRMEKVRVNLYLYIYIYSYSYTCC